ncbi:hypothetical protein H0H93_004125, partial [Arthromyces matolae]
TTFLFLSSDAYARYVQATGAILDPAIGLLTVNSTQIDSLQSLYFNINGVSSFLLSPVLTTLSDLRLPFA